MKSLNYLLQLTLLISTLGCSRLSKDEAKKIIEKDIGTQLCGSIAQFSHTPYTFDTLNLRKMIDSGFIIKEGSLRPLLKFTEKGKLYLISVDSANHFEDIGIILYCLNCGKTKVAEIKEMVENKEMEQPKENPSNLFFNVTYQMEIEEMTPVWRIFFNYPEPFITGHAILEKDKDGWKIYSNSLSAKEAKLKADSEAAVINFRRVYYDSIERYKKGYIAIGRQIWALVNLNVTTFRNGDPIPEVESEAEWVNASNKGLPAWCYYNGDVSNGSKYGKLYNWYAVHDSRGLAPQGWHIPIESEWTTLVNYLGGDEAGNKMKNTSGWENFGGGNGNNNSGFSALPAGLRLDDIGSFGEVSVYGYFWSSNENGSTDASCCQVWCGNSIVRCISNNKGCGFSVRCVKD